MSLKFLSGVVVALAIAATPALACKGRNVVLADDFSKEDPAWSRVFGEFAITGGKATLKGEPGFIAMAAYEGEFFDAGDGCIDVTFPDGGRQIPGIGGFAFGITDKDNFYAMFVNADGVAGILRLSKGKWLQPVPARKSDALKTGAGATNTLRITLKGTAATTYINDKPFAQINVPTIAGTKMGMYAEPEGLVWQFDNVKITD
ncbi:MAG: hypothetical protein QOI12_1097 [Alphaproteobacteria bacterium]|jgi:hypothetical protein|nr:hypothetical protein [Alphaproteobacteria bacterium]